MNRARFSCPEQGEYINSISGTMHIKDNITKVSESLRQSRWRSLALGVDHLQLPSPPSLPSRPAPSCSSPRAPLGAPAPPQPTATPAPFVRPHRDCSWDLVEEMERGKEKGALAGGFHAGRGAPDPCRRRRVAIPMYNARRAGDGRSEHEPVPSPRETTAPLGSLPNRD